MTTPSSSPGPSGPVPSADDVRLREALGAYGEAVETVHGYGYRLRAP